ncbi:transmembrane protein, putative [Medicago truncatula]|uniref:Transmembrane protein, putative n=1 Tax=Medicago truncatula TaxID=3880 RepID=A0A072U731_MEDTR|nr:transmembrane protein, putative [Medicago truncatula]
MSSCDINSFLESNPIRTNRGVLSHAVLNRQNAVFEYLIGLDSRNEFMSHEDMFGNNILHLAGEMPHSASIKNSDGFSLSRLKTFWFCGRSKTLHNHLSEPRKIRLDICLHRFFNLSHKDLVEEAAKWTTDLLSTTFIAVATIFWGASSVNTTRLPPDPSDYFVVASKIGSFLSFVSFLVFIALKVPLRNNEEFLKTI